MDKPPATEGISFEFSTAARVIFGAGSLAEAGPAAEAHGLRALVVTGRDESRSRGLKDLLLRHGVAVSSFPVTGEPTIHLIRRGVETARQEGCDQVVSIGGGAALDTGKAIAGLLANERDVLEYLEVIGGGRRLPSPAAPFIAIPTTAGTGTEVTRNSVITSPEHRVKVSLRSPGLMPRIALVDPELTHDLPPHLTATTGMDALTQLLEAFVCKRANPLTDSLARDGLRRVARSLRIAFDQGHDPGAREDMALAALFSGMALANAGLGAVHGLAAALGGMLPVPHGAVCAALLPPVVETNVRVLSEYTPTHPALRRYQEVATLITDSSTATATELADALRALVAHLGILGLAEYGLTESHLDELASKAARASSMKGNPVVLSPEHLQRVVRAAL